MITIPNAAEAILLDAVTGKTPITALTVRLYTALAPPLSNATVVAHVTQAAGGGYAGLPLTAANWVTTPGTPTSSGHPAQVFTFNGALTGNPAILGYYLTRADGALLAVEPLPAAFTPVSNGDTLTVTPTITLASVTND